MTTTPDTTRHLTAGELATMIRNQNQCIDDLRTALAELRARVFRLTVATGRIDLHRDSIETMRLYLEVLPRWRWIRRTRIRFQLAQIAIAIADTPKG